jgi:hypothetical protein
MVGSSGSGYALTITVAALIAPQSLWIWMIKESRTTLLPLLRGQQADMILPSPVAVIFAAVGFST